MLSKPWLSPPRQSSVAGASEVPSTSCTVALYSARFRRWIALCPGSTPLASLPGVRGSLGLPFGPPLEEPLEPPEALPPDGSMICPVHAKLAARTAIDATKSQCTYV